MAFDFRDLAVPILVAPMAGPHAVNVWAGTGYQKAEAAPVAQIISSLT